MTPILNLTHSNIQILAQNLASKLMVMMAGVDGFISLYPVPRGGVPVAYLLTAFGPFVVVDNPNDADVIIDD